MTKAEEVRQELCDMGTVIIDCPIERKSVVSEDGYIGIGQMDNSAEEHCVLTHDKWHIKLDAFYLPTSPYQAKEQAEARVNMNMAVELVPLDALCFYLRAEYTVDEIAEQFEVTEDIVLMAYLHYKDQFGEVI